MAGESSEEKGKARMQEVRDRVQNLRNEMAALAGWLEVGELEKARRSCREVAQRLVKVLAAIELLEK